MKNQYETMTLANLRELAKEKGLKNISTLKKGELVEVLARASSEEAVPVEKTEPEKAEVKIEEPKAARTRAAGARAEEQRATGTRAARTNEADQRITETGAAGASAADQGTTETRAAGSNTADQRITGTRTTRPGAADQRAAETRTARPGAADPRAAETRTARPGAADQRTAEARAARPGTTDQRTAEARTARPGTTDQRTAEARTARPGTADQRTAEARTVRPGVTEQRAAEARTVRQGAMEQRAAEMRAVQGMPEVKAEDTVAMEHRAAEAGGAEMRTAEPGAEQNSPMGREERRPANPNEMDQLDSGETKVGILEVLPDGYGFIRCDNYLPGENDVYVSPAQIRRFNLKTGDIIAGNTKIRSQNEKFGALLYVKSINGFHPAEAQKRKRFEDLIPVFPNERIHLETPGAGVSMRMVDLISPIGKGQRGMIVSQPKTGKTTLMKQIAKAVTRNHPEMKLIILLIDERPEEVTDIKESIEGKNVEVIYSTFDELPENHKRVSEMVIERAKRLVEHKQDVIILLDSITRLARAYNLTVQPSGRTLSGGLDPAALHMPKKFFGAARNMREGGSLTILATALVDTGSRMDDVVFEEFKGTGNMELVLDRSLSEKRIFPAIDLPRSSTRREDLLLTQSELEATFLMRKALGGMKSEEALERIIDMFLRTKTNFEFIEMIKKTKIVF
ncbi:transcription termination factor Rho [Anaerotaenia torta]|uniref:transcription termination factor Rho n=1 Tax=Anaerotaenia torta TaxID=433293 RepID=UPI003D21F213